MPDELNLSTIAKQYQDEDEVYKLVERIRWPNGPVCPHCGVIDHAYFLAPKDGARRTRTGSVTARRVYKCADCRKQFSVLKGTIFEDSKIPLSKWLLALHLLCSNKNGSASYELHRTLKLDRKSAWFLTMRIRHAMAQESLASKLAGIVEADETYFGGQAKNMHARQRKLKRSITGRTITCQTATCPATSASSISPTTRARCRTGNGRKKAITQTAGKRLTYREPGREKGD